MTQAFHPPQTLFFRASVELSPVFLYLSVAMAAKGYESSLSDPRQFQNLEILLEQA
jgi:hypothetical protein